MAVALMTFASQSTAQERASDASQHDPTNVVVAIVSRLGDTDVFGGGLISGYKDGRVYIATANHIVRRGPDQAAHIEIVIKRLPERRIKAILLERFDHGLDLAVLAISVRDADVVDPTRLPQGFARDAQFVSHGEALYSIGHPNGQLWRKSVTPDRFADVVGDGVRFESFSLAPGHSGGALVNADGEMIGMIRADQPPTGVASNMHALMRKFLEWGYPVSSWTFPADIGGTGSDRSRNSLEPLRVRGPTRRWNSTLRTTVDRSRGELLPLVTTRVTRSPVERSAATSLPFRLRDRSGFNKPMAGNAPSWKRTQARYRVIH